VQLSDLAARVKSALTEAGVRAVWLAGSVHQQSTPAKESTPSPRVEKTKYRLNDRSSPVARRRDA